jgi:hypothetical protein
MNLTEYNPTNGFFDDSKGDAVVWVWFVPRVHVLEAWASMWGCERWRTFKKWGLEGHP